MNFYPIFAYFSHTPMHIYVNIYSRSRLCGVLPRGAAFIGWQRRQGYFAYSSKKCKYMQARGANLSLYAC